ncbi:MAG: preprotein translocase subunit SecE [Gallicola sp.]|uniref:preprotein translocase subunit SecE n=1 Tax=Gallicola sp. Sow4_E12 TaxID=3438785 RepID=UPI00183FC85D|nr:preprotein translocase subunit SecE [Gallicola sp.]
MATKTNTQGNKTNTNFAKGIQSEWKKIVWPTKEQAIKYCVSVVIISILVALIVFGLDSIIHFLLGLIVR